MSGDCIATKTLVVYVQENGIIRAMNGRYLARLERDFDYDKLDTLPTEHVVFTVDELDHILNCFDHLFYIQGQSEETKTKWFEIIIKTIRDTRKRWIEAVKNNKGSMKSESNGVEG